MCGIIGYSRARKTSIPNGRDFMIAALHAIESRGRHATGAGWTTRDRQHVWYTKQEGPASEVAQRLDLPKRGMLNAIGHTRHATHGSPRFEVNNHPTVCGGVVCVHNGVLDNHVELLELVNVVNPGLVDSFAITALLANLDAAGADHPADALSLVEGCAAIAWLDSSDMEALHLARLSTRPLTIAWTKRGDLVFGSTRANLYAAARTANVHIYDVTDVGEGEYLRVEHGEVVGFRTIALPKPRYVRPDDLPTAPAKAKGKGGRVCSVIPGKQSRLPLDDDLFDTRWFDDAEWEARVMSRLDGPDAGLRSDRRGPFHGITDLLS